MDVRATLLLAALTVVGTGAYDCGTSNAFLCAIKTAGHTLKEAAITAVNLGSNLIDAGKAIISETVDVGSGLLAQGAKAIAGTIGNSLQKIGKREIELDPVVAGVLQEGKRFLQSLGSALKDKLEEVISKLVDISTGVLGLDFSRDVSNEVDGAVADFQGAAGKTAAAMVQGAEALLARILGHELTTSRRRGISDILASAAAALQNSLKAVTSAISPHLQTVGWHVATLGSLVKEQASNLAEVVKQSVTDLGSKLTDHVSTLVGHGQTLVQHGKDALGAAKDAISQITAQTLGNVKDTLGGATAIGKDAISVVVDHVSNGY